MSYTSNFNLNQRVSYLESEIGKIAPIPPGGFNLDNVLTIGNNAGANDIDLNNNDLLNVDKITSSSNITIDPSNTLIISGSLDLSCNLIQDVSGIFFCDGTYIGTGSSFDISANQVLVLSGKQDPSGSYNGSSIVAKDRVYQQINPDASWNAVNGYYGLAKDAYPVLNPTSSGIKAVSTWTARNTPNNYNYRGLCWSPELGLFVAVSITGTGDRVMTSIDGINWTLRSSPADNNWLSVVWSPELGIFVAVSSTGVANRVMTSPDGIVWTSQLTGISLTNCVASGTTITCDDTTGLTAGMNIGFVSGTGSVPSGTNVVSVDSPTQFTTNNVITTTTPLTLNADSNWNSVCWSAELGLFVAVSSINGTGNRVMTSPDGITWIYRTSAENNNWRSVCWSAELGIFVAVANNGTNRAMTSPDGINWTSQSIPTNELFGVCWSPELGIFVAVNSSGANRVSISPDGVVWTSILAPLNNWANVCWSAELGLFVAVANNTSNNIMTSPDGIVWTIRTAPNSNNLTNICWSPELGIFVAVAVAGTSNKAITSSLSGRPPTSYNVFDSSFNNIDSSGNWTIKAKEIYGDTIELEASNYVNSTSAISAPSFLSLHQFQGFPENTSSITNDTLSLTASKWTGGVLAPNGKIYGVPNSANSVLIYDPISKQVDITSIPVISGASKWSGGVLAENNKIYCVPDATTNRNILVIDPKTNTTELYPFVKNGRWAGGVLAPNGNIYCVPALGDVSANNLMSVLEINPKISPPTISFITTDLSGNDGNDDELFGGVLAPNGKIYCIPRLCSKILVIDTTTTPVSTYTLTKPTTLGTSQWSFGALGGDGCVYGCPRRANAVLKIDPSGDVVSGVGAFTEVTNGFFGAVLAPSNKIYFPTLNGTTYLEFDVETATTIERALPTLTSSAPRFFGGVLTPQNEVMFIPAGQDAIVEVKTGLPKLNNWVLNAYFNKL
jgi:hypothetical protein